MPRRGGDQGVEIDFERRGADARAQDAETRARVPSHRTFGPALEINECGADLTRIGITSRLVPDDDTDVLTWIHGIVPIPEDYVTRFKMDFITYDGATSDPPGPSTNWSSIGKDTWDGHQMFFMTPLTRQQMTAIGMAELCEADLDFSGDVGFGDILTVIGLWGPCTNCPEDLSGNGQIDFADILAIIGAWGPC
ncbi:MAG: hypothetical protein GY715_16535 [Planctomycetes bacterium]|nr:hypothetical protein [Planctomycetota bacterium]